MSWPLLQLVHRRLQLLQLFFCFPRLKVFPTDASRDLSLSLSCVLSPVWGYRGEDIHSSEERLGPRDPHAAKSPH